jgi:integrase
MPVKVKPRRPHRTGSVRPKGRRWEGRFHHKGKPRYVSLGVRKEVDPENGITRTAAFEKLERHMATYEAPDPNGRVTFSAICPKFVAHKKSKNRSKTTMSAIDVAIRVHLEPEFGPRYMDAISADDLEEWMAKELRTASPKSVKNWRSVANSIWEFALKKKVVSENVVAQTEAPYVPRKEDVDVMSTADIAAVRDSVPDTDMGRLLSLIVLVATRCGLRESEIIALRWRDIQWETGWIRVVQGHVRGETKLPKGKKGRVTPMPDIVKVPLRAHHEATSWGRPDDLVFGHPVDGSRLDASSLNERFKEAVVASGIRPIEMRSYKQRDGSTRPEPYVALSFHDCRHAWCTWCISNGIPSALVMKWGGWEDPQTMAIYEHWRPAGFEVDMLNAAVDREGQAILPPVGDGSIGPREWLHVFSQLRERCGEEGIDYPFGDEDEKLILAGATAPV